MLRQGQEQMVEAESPRPHALALLMALLDRGGSQGASNFLALAPQLPVRPLLNHVLFMKYIADGLGLVALALCAGPAFGPSGPGGKPGRQQLPGTCAPAAGARCQPAGPWTLLLVCLWKSGCLRVLALLIAVLHRGGSQGASNFLALAPQLPVRLPLICLKEAGCAQRPCSWGRLSQPA